MQKYRAPLSPEKAEGPVQVISFLGMLLDFLRQVIMIPEDKIEKAVNLIREALGSMQNPNKNMKGKIAVKLLQRITGTLNFISRAVPVGRAFTRHLYDLQATGLPVHLRKFKNCRPNPEHKVRLDLGARKDLTMWLQFLENENFRMYREVPFMHFVGEDKGPMIFVDASGNPLKGFGCVFLEIREFTYARWPVQFFYENGKPTYPGIVLLELYAIIVAVETWAEKLRG